MQGDPNGRKIKEDIERKAENWSPEIIPHKENDKEIWQTIMSIQVSNSRQKMDESDAISIYRDTYHMVLGSIPMCCILSMSSDATLGQL